MSWKRHIRKCQLKIAFTILSVIFIVINNIPPGSLRSSWCQIEFANNISRRIGCKREKLVSCTVENKGYRLIWIIEYRIWIVCVDRICIIHYYFNNFKSFLPFRFVKSKSGGIHRKIEDNFLGFSNLGFGSHLATKFFFKKWTAAGGWKQSGHRKLQIYFYERKRCTKAKGNKYDSQISFFSIFLNNIGVGSWSCQKWRRIWS